MSRRGLLQGSTLSIESVRSQVNRWRETRARRGRMPKELWEAAASLAREHGLYAVSRGLRVNYDSLREHVKRGSGDRAGTLRPNQRRATPGFVELGPVTPIGSATAGVTVELVGSGGSRMTIRLPSSAGLDVSALAREFWSYAK